MNDKISPRLQRALEAVRTDEKEATGGGVQFELALPFWMEVQDQQATIRQWLRDEFERRGIETKKPH